MKRIIKSMLFGAVMYSLVFSLIIAWSLIICLIRGVEINHTLFLVILIRGLKGGVVPGVALAIIFYVGSPRPRISK